jgi:hypothetical protein
MTECVKYNAFGEGAHYSMRVPGHKGEKCWYSADGSPTPRHRHQHDEAPVTAHADARPEMAPPAFFASQPADPPVEVTHVEPRHVDKVVPKRVKVVTAKLGSIDVFAEQRDEPESMPALSQPTYAFNAHATWQEMMRLDFVHVIDCVSCADRRVKQWPASITFIRYRIDNAEAPTGFNERFAAVRH